MVVVQVDMGGGQCLLMEVNNGIGQNGQTNLSR